MKSCSKKTAWKFLLKRSTREFHNCVLLGKILKSRAWHMSHDPQPFPPHQTNRGSAPAGTEQHQLWPVLAGPQGNWFAPATDPTRAEPISTVSQSHSVFNKLLSSFSLSAKLTATELTVLEK